MSCGYPPLKIGIEKPAVEAPVGDVGGGLVGGGGRVGRAEVEHRAEVGCQLQRPQLAHGQAVPQQQVVGRTQGGGAVMPAGRVLTDLVTQDAGAPGLVQGGDAAHLVAQPLAHDPGVLGKVVRRSGGWSSRPRLAGPAADPSGRGSGAPRCRADSGRRPGARRRPGPPRWLLRCRSAECAARPPRSGRRPRRARRSDRGLAPGGGSGRRPRRRSKPSRMRPGSRQNVSQMLSPRPPSWAAPSI